MKTFVALEPDHNDPLDIRLNLHLSITDPDIVTALSPIRETRERDQYAVAAMKVGVLAIRQASGVLDSRTIHDQCADFLKTIGETLSEHTESVSSQVASLLTKY